MKQIVERPARRRREVPACGFVRRSPRGTAILALGGFQLIFIVLPLLLPAAWFWFWSGETLVRNRLFPLLLLLFPLPLIGGCLILLWCALAELLRRAHVARWFRFASGLGALCPLLAGLFVGAALFRCGRRKFALTAFAGAVVGGIQLALMVGRFSFPFSPCGWFWVVNGATVAVIAAICAFPGRRKIRIAVFLPSALSVAVLGGFAVESARLTAEISRARSELASLLGAPVTLEEFRKLERTGFPVEREPLRSLIAGEVELEAFDPASPPAELRKKYAALCREHAGELRVLAEFLKLPPQRIQREIKEEGPLYDIMLSECRCFREAARILALRMAAHAEEPAVVRACNDGMIRLREWCLANFSLIHKLAAVWLEQFRLTHLALPLAAGTFRAEEWPALLGAEPAWERAFAEAVGTEAVAFEELYRLIVPLIGSCWEKPSRGYDPLTPLQRKLRWSAPWEMRILFQRDCLFALEEYQTQVRLFLHPGNTTAVERMKRGAFPEAHEKVIARLHLLSLLTLPALPQSHLRAGGAVGARRLLEIAVAVMEYRKTHGRLPDDLRFLPQLPVDPVTGKAIGYEKGLLEMAGTDGKQYRRSGFRLFLPYDRSGEPCAEGKRAAIALPVLLREE